MCMPYTTSDVDVTAHGDVTKRDSIAQRHVA